MKAYTVTLIPSIFELPENTGMIYEGLDLSYLPESMLQVGELIRMTRIVEADNIQDALSKIRSYLRVYDASRTPSTARVFCYNVTLSYFYGSSYREKSFDFWVSRGLRRHYLKENRSYLTDDQIASICSSALPSFDRYLTK